MRERRVVRERMDDPGISPEELESNLRHLRFINRFLNGEAASLGALSGLAAAPATVLDVGAGGGDIGGAMREKRGFSAFALDFHALTVRRAHERLPAVRGDARRLPFPDASFDLVHCSTMLHHFPDDGAISVLREMDRVARVGLVVNDLVRSRRLLLWVALLTLFGRPHVRRDGALSVRASFRRDEILALARRAGVTYLRYRPCFGHRFLLWGRKVEQRA